jgi:DNA-binding NtrC family response regulator
MGFTVLIVDDEPKICLTLRDILRKQGFEASFCTDPHDVIPTIRSSSIDLLLIDVKMPGQDGIDLLRSVRAAKGGIPVIMISGHATIETVVVAMKYGAINFYTKPIDNRMLISEISRLAELKGAEETAPADTPLISQDPAMLKVIELAKKAAPTDATVIITGESGTGKELVADLIHAHSARSGYPFIKINCAAIPEDLLESEMFGHERGAFTDAKFQKQGIFERAGQGAIFLDEIGDMSPKIQAKMLRVLQDGSFTRVGGSAVLRAGCRIITATNKNLKGLIEKGAFREDLYYRLSVITLHLPPLRDRPGDIPALADAFLREFNAKYGKSVRGFSEDINTFFLGHDWPGNVRELKNLVERTVIFSQGGWIESSMIPEQYKFVSEETREPPSSGGGSPGRGSTPPGFEEPPLDVRYRESDREVILEALRKSRGVKQRAAEMLGIDRKTLYRKMKSYGIGT